MMIRKHFWLINTETIGLDVLMYNKYTPRISPRFLITRLKIASV
jgi:hypothetical protein